VGKNVAPLGLIFLIQWRLSQSLFQLLYAACLAEK